MTLRMQAHDGEAGLIETVEELLVEERMTHGA
jgi:hypothetical protein